MKILVINAYAGSPHMGMVFRHYHLAKEWAQHGHKVLIVAGSFSHLRQNNPDVVSDLQETEEDGVHYLWIRNEPYTGNGMKRAKSMLAFAAKLYRNARKIINRFTPDIVLASCTDPLDTYGAQKIARLAHASLIHEVRDLWPLTLTELYGVSRYNPAAVIMQIAENSMCQHSDRLTSVLPASEEHFTEHGLKKGRFKFIPNGIDEEEWDHIEEPSEEYLTAVKQLRDKGKFIICFFGSHTRSYALEHLIHAVQELDTDRVAVVFIGKGLYKETLIKVAEARHAERFVFLDPVAKRYIPDVLSHMDALYVAGIRNDIFRFGVAMNKMFDSMMAGKPILYALEAPNNYIEEYQAGISVEAENEGALKKGIETLIATDEATLHQMGENGHKAVLEHFTYSVIAEQFLDLFKESG